MIDWEPYFEPKKKGSYWYSQYENVRKTAIAERNERVILQNRLREVKAERDALKAYDEESVAACILQTDLLQ